MRKGTRLSPLFRTASKEKHVGTLRPKSLSLSLRQCKSSCCHSFAGSTYVQEISYCICPTMLLFFMIVIDVVIFSTSHICIVECSSKSPLPTLNLQRYPAFVHVHLCMQGNSCLPLIQQPSTIFYCFVLSSLPTKGLPQWWLTRA